MELVKPSQWASKCEAVEGTMLEISQKINQINAQPNQFVVATHRPSKVKSGINNHPAVYETLIFYKIKQQVNNK